MSRDFSSRDSKDGTTRRALLRTLGVAPLAATLVISPWNDAIAALHAHYDDPPAALCRSRDGRSLSRARYHRAESFFHPIERQYPFSKKELLYQSGIVAQLALSSHLLDVGFTDPWCARHIGLYVAKSLAYANATGFDHDCPEMSRLAAVLSPYWKWNDLPLDGDPPPLGDGGFTKQKVCSLLRVLLDRVHDVTGHPRPKGWRRDRQEARS